MNRKTGRSLAVNSSGRIDTQPGGTERKTLQWVRSPQDGEFFRLTSAVTGATAHVENETGVLELGDAGPGWWSAQWRLEAAPES